jgi:hypothetical protein
MVTKVLHALLIEVFLLFYNVPVDSEAPVVTSLISRFASSTQFFGGARRDRVYVRAFIRVSVRSCM